MSLSATVILRSHKNSLAKELQPLYTPFHMKRININPFCNMNPRTILLPDGKMARTAQSAVHAESIQLLATLGEGLSGKSLRSISNFIRYLHERETRGRENGGSVTPSANSVRETVKHGAPGWPGQRVTWATRKPAHMDEQGRPFSRHSVFP